MIMNDRKKVLIVDDDERYAGQVAQFLGRHGYETLMAENVQQAMALYAGHSPDCLVTDCCIGDESGAELAEQVIDYGKKSDRKTRIVLMSDAEIDAYKNLEHLGVDAFYYKRDDLSKLLEKLNGEQNV